MQSDLFKSDSDTSINVELCDTSDQESRKIQPADDTQNKTMATDFAPSCTSNVEEESKKVQSVDVIPPRQLATNRETFETSSSIEEEFFGLLAENCYLKLSQTKNREEQQGIIINCALRFVRWNDHSRRHFRRYLEDEMEKHGVSQRTLLRMLPRHLKDQSRMLNRLGKRKQPQDSAQVPVVKPISRLHERVGFAYQEPD